MLVVARRPLVIIVGFGTLLTAANGSAQTNGQVWANITFDWVKRSGVMYEVDFEPKALVFAPPEEPGWGNLDITPSIEYPVSTTIDLIGEVTLGRTKQSDDLDTTELTVRGGVRFHLFSRQRHLLLNETLPKRRLVIRDLVRVESRNFFYSNDDPSESTIRVRNRVELLWPLNRPNLGDDGAVVALTDWEWFIPVSIPRSVLRTASAFVRGSRIVTASIGDSPRSTSGTARATRRPSRSQRPNTSSTFR